jgi:hypothetical protein
MKNAIKGTVGTTLAGATLLALTACGSAGTDTESGKSELEIRSELNQILADDPGNQAARGRLAELDRASAEAFGLLHTAVLPEHGRLLFFEPEPGRLIVAEVGSIANQPLTAGHELERASGLEIFRTLLPEEEVPQPLLDAQQRADAVDRSTAVEGSPGSEVGAPSPALPSLRPLHATSSGSHFRDTHAGCPTFGFDDFCWLNRINSWTESASAAQSQMRVGNYGTINFTFALTSGGGSLSTTVLPAEIWTFTQPVGAPSTITGTLTTTSSGKWHWGGTFAN